MAELGEAGGELLALSFEGLKPQVELCQPSLARRLAGAGPQKFDPRFGPGPGQGAELEAAVHAHPLAAFAAVFWAFAGQIDRGQEGGDLLGVHSEAGSRKQQLGQSAGAGAGAGQQARVENPGVEGFGVTEHPIRPHPGIEQAGGFERRLEPGGFGGGQAGGRFAELVKGGSAPAGAVGFAGVRSLRWHLARGGDGCTEGCHLRPLGRHPLVLLAEGRTFGEQALAGRGGEGQHGGGKIPHLRGLDQGQQREETLLVAGQLDELGSPGLEGGHQLLALVFFAAFGLLAPLAGCLGTGTGLAAAALGGVEAGARLVAVLAPGEELGNTLPALAQCRPKGGTGGSDLCLGIILWRRPLLGRRPSGAQHLGRGGVGGLEPHPLGLRPRRLGPALALAPALLGLPHGAFFLPLAAHGGVVLAPLVAAVAFGDPSELGGVLTFAVEGRGLAHGVGLFEGGERSLAVEQLGLGLALVGEATFMAGAGLALFRLGSAQLGGGVVDAVVGASYLGGPGAGHPFGVVAVDLEKLRHRRHPGGDRLELLPVFLQALEALRHRTHQLSVQSRQAFREQVREALRVEFFREMGAPESKEQLTQGGKAVFPQPKEPGIELVPVVLAPLEELATGPKVRAQPLAGERRPALEQGEVAADTLRSEEVPGVDLLASAAGAKTTTQGEEVLCYLTGVFDPPAELEPDITQAALEVFLEQVPAHAAGGGGKGVEALRREVGVEQERQQQLQGFAFSGAVFAPQDQPPLLEPELLVLELPEAEDTGAQRSKTRRGG